MDIGIIINGIAMNILTHVSYWMFGVHHVTQ